MCVLMGDGVPMNNGVGLLYGNTESLISEWSLKRLLILAIKISISQVCNADMNISKNSA